MLVLARHSDESFFIGLDPSTPIGEVFREPMEIAVSRVIGKDQVRIAIDAPDELGIARTEMFEELDTAHGL